MLHYPIDCCQFTYDANVTRYELKCHRLSRFEYNDIKSGIMTFVDPHDYFNTKLEYYVRNIS